MRSYGDRLASLHHGSLASESRLILPNKHHDGMKAVSELFGLDRCKPHLYLAPLENDEVSKILEAHGEKIF
jgi:hypothetical protein